MSTAVAGLRLDIDTILKFPEVMEFRNAWTAAKATPAFLINWLQQQVLGELSAIASMDQLRTTLASTEGAETKVAVVDMVLKDEHNHVHLLGELLRARGTEPNPNLQGIPLEHMDEEILGCAIASRAEGVRLGQIYIVMNDADVPADVRVVLEKISKDETFHQKAYAHLAGDQGPAELSTALQRNIHTAW